MATNVLGVILGWLYNSLLLGLLHCGFSIVLFIFLPLTPYELVRTGNVGDLTDLLKTLRGEEGEIIAEEASFIIRYPSIYIFSISITWPGRWTMRRKSLVWWRP